MTSIQCVECRESLLAEEVIIEGGGSDFTCPYCGMSDCVRLIYDVLEIDAAKAEAKRIEEEFYVTMDYANSDVR